MASSKLNIFMALPQHASDDEDEGFSKAQAKGAQGKKTNAPKDDKGKGGKGGSGPTGGNQGDAKQGKDEHKKGKGVPAPGTHPLERHSGTGQAAYDKKLKKGGAGKGNWGSNRQERDDGTKEEEAEGENAKEEPQQPTGITLDEYYQKHQPVKADPQINEAKAKVTSDLLMKEVLSNKATVLQGKKAKDVDDHKAGKKKTALASVDHHAEITTEHADLLNFRTGFIEREFRQRSDGEKPAPKDFKKREEKTEGTEKTEEGKTTEGGETAEKTEGQEGAGEEGGEKRGYSGRGNRGGPRGRGRGGYSKGGSNPQPKLNVVDESDFPKLG